MKDINWVERVLLQLIILKMTYSLVDGQFYLHCVKKSLVGHYKFWNRNMCLSNLFNKINIILSFGIFFHNTIQVFFMKIDYLF